MLPNYNILIYESRGLGTSKLHFDRFFLDFSDLLEGEREERNTRVATPKANKSTQQPTSFYVENALIRLIVLRTSHDLHFTKCQRGLKL